MARAPAHRPPPEGGRLLALAPALPLALAAIAYTRVLWGEFQLDDWITIRDNPSLRSLGGALRSLVLAPGSRPLTDLTFALNFAAGGLDPFGYHLVNLAVHLAVVALVGALARRLAARAGASRPEALATATAGLFAVHPLLSQAVAYVTQRAELLGSLCYVATLLGLLAVDRAEGRRAAAAAWAGTGAAFLAGLLAKQIVVTAPAAWLLLAAAAPAPGPRPWRARLGRAARQAAPLAAVAALFAWWTLAGLRGLPHAGFDVPGIPPATYALTQLRVVLLYLRLIAWPAGLNVDHAVPLSSGLDVPTALAGAALLALLAGSLWLLARADGLPAPAAATARLAGLGVPWFLLLLAPTSTVVPLADVVFEHRAYLAALGPLLALVAAAAHGVALLPGPARRWAGPALAGAAWVALAAVLQERNAVWETRLALWADAAEKSPGLARVQMNLGHALAEAGEGEAAAAAFRRALALPTDGRIRPAEMRRNLATVLTRLGRLDEAGEVVRAGLADEPGNPDLLVAGAVLAGQQGRPAEAEALARRALAASPGHLPALGTLGEARLAQGDAAGALEAFQRALALDPDAAGFRRLNVARALAALGRGPEACAAAGQAVRAEPSPEQRRWLAEAAAGLGCAP